MEGGGEEGVRKERGEGGRGEGRNETRRVSGKEHSLSRSLTKPHLLRLTKAQLENLRSFKEEVAFLHQG